MSVEFRNGRHFTPPRSGESWSAWQSRRSLFEIYAEALYEANRRQDKPTIGWLLANPPTPP